MLGYVNKTSHRENMYWTHSTVDAANQQRDINQLLTGSMTHPSPRSATVESFPNFTPPLQAPLSLNPAQPRPPVPWVVDLPTISRQSMTIPTLAAPPSYASA